MSNQTKYDYEIATLLSNHVPVDASQPVDDRVTRLAIGTSFLMRGQHRGREWGGSVAA